MYLQNTNSASSVSSIGNSSSPNPQSFCLAPSIKTITIHHPPSTKRHISNMQVRRSHTRPIFRPSNTTPFKRCRVTVGCPPRQALACRLLAHRLAGPGSAKHVTCRESAVTNTTGVLDIFSVTTRVHVSYRMTGSLITGPHPSFKLPSHKFVVLAAS